MELTTPAIVLAAFYRLVGTDEDDPALIEHGEAENDVAFQYLTRGARTAQRWMLKQGYDGWRVRSTALTFSGSDDVDGGRYASLPTNFLRAYGNRKRSALVEAGGNRWGREIDPEQDDWRGDGYYIRGEQLWLTRMASPPTTLYLDFHFKHPTWTASVTIDFPMDARALIIAEAANVAKEENWLTGGRELEAKIERALVRAQKEAHDIARPTKSPRRMKEVVRHGNRW